MNDVYEEYFGEITETYHGEELDVQKLEDYGEGKRDESELKEAVEGILGDVKMF